MVWVVAALLIFIFQVLTILLLEFRHSGKTVAWLLVLFMFPFVGFVMYYFFAQEYKKRRYVRRRGYQLKDIRSESFKYATILARERETLPDAFTSESRLFGVLQNIPESPITKCNKSRVLTNAEETYDALWAAIRTAKHHIHVEYYIIRADEVGEKLRGLLIEKAEAGVEVRVLYDGIGSYELKEDFLQPMRKAGIELACFLPPLIALFDKRINYRNHRKIVIVDGRIGFLGGINIGGEYLGRDPKLGFWRDTHLMLEGDSVYYLQHTFFSDWGFAKGNPVDGIREYFPKHNCGENELLQIIASGPDTPWDPILEMFFAAISTAKERVYFTTPYFIPDESIVMALKTAAIAGVDVRMIIPEKGDSKLVNWATLSYLADLMQSGVRIYQYQKGFIHAKVLIIDHTLASVGTANVDMRSFFSNFELNAVIFSEEVIRRVEHDFIHDLKDSLEIKPEEFDRRSKRQRVLEAVSRLLSPLL